MFNFSDRKETKEKGKKGKKEKTEEEIIKEFDLDNYDDEGDAISLIFSFIFSCNPFRFIFFSLFPQNEIIITDDVNGQLDMKPYYENPEEDPNFVEV